MCNRLSFNVLSCYRKSIVVMLDSSDPGEDEDVELCRPVKVKDAWYVIEVSLGALETRAYINCTYIEKICTTSLLFLLHCNKYNALWHEVYRLRTYNCKLKLNYDIVGL